MKKMLKRGLCFVLMLMMMTALLPVTAYAKVDGTGRPLDLANKLVVSIYTTEGTFPGEPATHGSDEYISFNSRFAKTTASGQFKSSAESELDPSILGEDVLIQGTANGNNTVWGVFSADGLGAYFKSGATINVRANELKMIDVVFDELKIKDRNPEDYEIIWYVIKLQHSSSFWGGGTTEWHIDGLIREKATPYVSINYYGNGNTSGYAPDGTTIHTSGDDYVVLGLNDSDKPMKKVINGVEVAFLGWSAKADGTGEEAGFYKAGDVIKNLDKNISLYAMWDTNTQYTATVNTYLDGVLADEADIHDGERNLYLSTDEIHYHQLTRSSEGVYTTKITGNGKFHLYNKNADGTYTQVGDRQLTIYNQNGNMDVHHYSVTYDLDGGSFAADPGQQLYYYGNVVNAVAEVPTKAGFQFKGWKVDENLTVQPGGEVTSSITAPITLTAQWEKNVNVTVNVTIDHNGGDGFNQVDTKDDVSLTLVSRENSGSPYLEVQGKTLTLNGAHDGFTYVDDEENHITTYTASNVTFPDMPGGTAEYTVVTSKSGYDTAITATQDETTGDWIVNVVMTYRPSNFDLDFTVQVHNDVPDRYIPDAAIVKVTFWANRADKQGWEIITQQKDELPGVRVDIDPATRSGSGSYPVWKYESDGTTPYGYRIEVTSFVYPDGTIVRANKEMTPDVAWTDDVYTATVQDVTGGKKFGTLDGAYIGDNDLQEGTLKAVITMDLHDVIFDAMGGTVNDQAQQLVKDQYKVPSFKDYVPTRKGGYIFDGWYLDEEYKNAATEGVDLNAENTVNGNITLYAKWIEPRTIRGTVTIAGTYDQNGKKVDVHEIDKATEAVIVLQEIRNGVPVEVNSRTINFGDYSKTGSATYEFSELPNDGKEYQIHVMELNYTTGYDNNQDKVFGDGECSAVFGTGNEAVVDAHLEFAPPSYNQKLAVDATQIGENYRPKQVLTQVLYRDTGDNHPYHVISQHDVEPYGVQINLEEGTEDGKPVWSGTGTQSIWNWHTDGTLYDYQMNITKVDGEGYDSDSAPYYITYSAANNATTPDVALQAVLIPKQYLVSFDMNAGTDTVTGMDSFKLTYEAEDGTVVTTDIYGVIHTWSYDTAIDAVPQRDGYTFTGWTASAKDVYVDGKIPAAVHQEVTLTAQWEETYRVEVSAVTGGIASGTADYVSGEKATVTATANDRYKFLYWKEGAEQVSDKAIYSFSVTGNRNLVAHFAPAYQITAEAETGGTTTGTGWYTADEKVTLTATPKDSYNFIGWYENGEFVSNKAEYTLQEKVTGDRIFTAKFKQAVSFECDYVYLFGYNDSEIGATGPLLRGELAQMIYRLVKQNDRGITPGNNSYSNTDNQWFESGISYMVKVGALDESKANVPDASVTCGETYKMICLGLGFTQDTSLDYSQYAAILGNYKLPADRRVTATIKRWEFCELFNDILGRSDCVLEDADGNEITPETYNYTDLKKGDSYYEIMMIATSAFEGRTVSLEKRMERNTYDYDGE